MSALLKESGRLVHLPMRCEETRSHYTPVVDADGEPLK